MSTAHEPVRRPHTAGIEYDLSSEALVAPELSILHDWLPEATPTDGQPYKATRALREHPPAPKPGRVHPRGIDSSGRAF